MTQFKTISAAESLANFIGANELKVGDKKPGITKKEIDEFRKLAEKQGNTVAALGLEKIDKNYKHYTAIDPKGNNQLVEKSDIEMLVGKHILKTETITFNVTAIRKEKNEYYFTLKSKSSSVAMALPFTDDVVKKYRLDKVKVGDKWAVKSSSIIEDGKPGIELFPGVDGWRPQRHGKK